MAKRRIKSRPAKPPPLTLSFATDLDKRARKLAAGRGRDFWTVKETGDYLVDYEAGERLAEQFLRYLNLDPDIGLGLSVLGWIARDMIAKGRFEGLEVGFFYRVSRACLDHPLLRLTADQSTPPMMTEAQFEERYAAATREHRERMKNRA
jgi:hypothetical protein